MLRAKFSIYLILILSVISCAGIKKVNKDISLKIKPLDHLIQEPIHYINKKIESAKSAQDLQALVSWGLGQDVKVAKYLKEQIFIKAQFAYLKGDYKSSLISLEQAINLDDKDDYLKLKYALNLVRLGELKKALTALKNIQTENHDEKSLLLLAGIQVSLNQTQQARQAYKKIVEKNPKALEACKFLGRSYVEEAKYTKAKKQYLKCLKTMPKEASFHLEIAKVNLLEKKSQLAIINLKKALKIDPDYSQAALIIGRIYEEDKSFTKAFSVYSQYLEANPEDFYMLNKMANWFLERNQTGKALSYIESLIDLDPGNSSLRVKLGILYVESQQYSKAISLFGEFLEQNPKEEKVHYYLAAVYQEVQSFEKAIHHYSQIGQKNKLFEDSVLQIASILNFLAINNKDYEEQFTNHIQKNTKFKSIEIELQVIHASYYEKEQRYSEAVKVMESASKNKDFQESHVLYLVSLYEKNEQFSSVDKELKKLINRDPSNARALNFLGYFYLERGEKLDEAKSLITRALELRPNDGYIRDSLGWYYYLQGDFEKSLSYLKKAYKDSSEDDEVALHLAQAYQSAGKLDKALSYYRKIMLKTNDVALKEQVANSVQKVISLQNAKRLPASIDN